MGSRSHWCAYPVEVYPHTELTRNRKKILWTDVRTDMTSNSRSIRTSLSDNLIKTKARFSRLLRHPAWKWRRPILISALHESVTYLLRHLSVYLQPRDPHGATNQVPGRDHQPPTPLFTALNITTNQLTTNVETITKRCMMQRDIQGWIYECSGCSTENGPHKFSDPKF